MNRPCGPVIAYSMKAAGGCQVACRLPDEKAEIKNFLTYKSRLAALPTSRLFYKLGPHRFINVKVGGCVLLQVMEPEGCNDLVSKFFAVVIIPVPPYAVSI